ncbi:MAG: FtsX-like permease family protein [Acidobacteriota bacterium]
MLRSLIHHRRVSTAVVLAGAVATAVLTGALLVGDSVRGSLADLTRERLGRIDEVLVGPRFFREHLADELTAPPDRVCETVVPAIFMTGSAVHGTTGARTSGVSVRGVDGRFLDLLDWPDGGVPDLATAEGASFPPVVVNESLARDLDAHPGDPILLSFPRASDVPRDTVLGEKDPASVVKRLRLTVVGVVSDRGGGRFGLAANQVAPRNAFVPLSRLQRTLDLAGRANVLLAACAEASPTEELDRSVGAVLSLADLGLSVTDAGDRLDLQSRRLVLAPSTVKVIDEVAAAEGLPVRHVVTYLANRIEVGRRAVPYSTVSGLDLGPAPPFETLRPIAGHLDGGLGDREIVLNEWAATDLSASPGDEVRLTYFAVGPHEELRTASASFTLRAVVAMEGLGADAGLTPDYPGIQDAGDMAGWNPPFPVDLSQVRPEDEAYWDRWRAVPKAFVSLATGSALWGTRHGAVTSVRVAASTAAARNGFLEDVRTRLLSAAHPFRFQPVKTAGLSAASGATDFSMLFVSFSFFLILAAAMLVTLLFGLGVEQRAREIGLRRAIGTPMARVRNQLLGEGLLLAVVGGGLGVAGGWAYGWLMMTGLRTVWVGAVGTPVLFLHVTATSLLGGWIGSVLVVEIAVGLAVRRLRKVAPTALLAGAGSLVRRAPAGRVTTALALGGWLTGAGLLATMILTGAGESPGLAFGVGGALLVGCLATFARWCRRRPPSTLARAPGPIAMAARNSAENPGRSLLSMALVASTSFIIILVAANRHEFGDEETDRRSGTGGFALLAEATVPVVADLSSETGRAAVGLSADASLGPDVEIFPLRLLPGNDASCLNLYRPSAPRVLGVPPEFVARGGFTFQAHAAGPTAGWNVLTSSFDDGAIPAIADAKSAQWLWKLGLGDDVILPDEAGRLLHLRLVGLLQASIFQSEILIPEAAFLEHFPGRAGYSVFAVDAPAARSASVGLALERGLAPFGVDAVSTRERLARFQAVENTYLSTFQMLGGLGLLLGTVGLGLVLLRNVSERRGELATLRACGFARRRLTWMIAAETGFLLATGLAAGSIAALASAVPRLVTGSLHLPWAFLGGTLAIVLVTGMLSCVAAVAGALRQPLLPSLKAER